MKKKWRYICQKCGSIYLVESDRTKKEQRNAVPTIRCPLKTKMRMQHLSGNSGCGYMNATFDPLNPEEGAKE